MLGFCRARGERLGGRPEALDDLRACETYRGYRGLWHKISIVTNDLLFQCRCRGGFSRVVGKLLNEVLYPSVSARVFGVTEVGLKATVDHRRPDL